MSEQIERAAEAVYAVIDLTKKPWAAASEAYKNDCRRIARAVISAVREPTEAMVGAAHDPYAGPLSGEIRAIWVDMIDAILEETAPTSPSPPA